MQFKPVVYLHKKGQYEARFRKYRVQEMGMQKMQRQETGETAGKFVGLNEGIKSAQFINNRQSLVEQVKTINHQRKSCKNNTN